MAWVCKKCGWACHYDVGECIKCKQKLEEVKPSKLSVRGVTEVLTPSAGHTQVPHYDLLLEDDKGNFFIKKSMEKHAVGDEIKVGDEGEAASGTVGVVGTGIGSGIAQVALQAGFNVVLKSRSEEALRKAKAKIEKRLAKGLGAEELKALLANLKGTTDFSDLKDCDIIIESVIEDDKVKKDLFTQLNEVCAQEAVFASNTSSLSIDELAAASGRPEKFVGLHFFNPPEKMKLVEVVKGAETSKQALDTAVKIAESLNKTVVVVKDSPCFIVNRILMPYLNEAVLVFEEGTAGAADIDEAAKLGLNAPMGPLALLDLIGLDVFVEIMNNLFKRTSNPKYKPAETAVKMMDEGRLGRKSGQGFYAYKK